MFFSPFERMMAWRYLRARKAEGFVSVIAGFSFLGILLGVATLIIVMSVMNGFRQELITRLLGLNGHLSVYRSGSALTDYAGLAESLRGISGIVSVAPLIQSQALLTVGGVSSGVVVRGMSAESFAAKPLLGTSIVQGNIEDFREGAVAVGSAMAEKLDLKIGEPITLLSSKVRATPFGGIPRSRTFTVGLVFDVGMHEYNANFIFMPLKDAQNFFQLPGAVTELEVITGNPARIDAVKQAAALALDGMAGVYDWRDSNKTFLGALEVERNVMFIILTLIIVVAAFNIISSMIMLVKDKSRDIAIMRTMGASRGSMMRIFMLAGASIGVAGTLGGALFGVLFALNIEGIRQAIQHLIGVKLFAAEIYFFSQLPAKIDWAEVAAVIVMALVLSVLATLYPARRAARLDPVEALRYE